MLQFSSGYDTIVKEGGRMTELMIRFQEETGIDLFGGWTYEIVNGMMTPPLSESPWMKFNEWLCNKLTWRPVSEKPEKDGRYFAEVKPYTGCESTIITTAYFDGERFLWHDVVRWLPIPPAPEGE